MANWIAIVSKEPQQYFNEEGEVFLACYQRISGGPDSGMPRRILGTGSTRAHATASAHRAISRYDSTYRVVSSR